VSAPLAPPPRGAAARRMAALSHVEAQPGEGDGRWTLVLEFAGVAPGDVPALGPADVRILALGDLPMRVVGVSPVPGAAALRVDAEREPEPPDPETVPRSRAYLLSLAGAPQVDPAADRAPFSLGSAAAASAPPPAAPAPVRPDGVHVDYLAKDYDSFRTLLLDYMAAAAPRWTERSPADLGMVLVELLAYAGDALSYFQDAAATEAYLHTARRRTSVRRHARLMDYHPSDGCSAVAWVHVAVSGDGLTLPAGTELLTRIPGAAPCLCAGSPPHQRALALSRVFETLEPLRPRAAHNLVPLHTWGMPECVLARGSTRATLVDGAGPDGRGTLSLAVGDVLVLEEARAADTGAAGQGDPTHRCAVRLVRVVPKTDPAAPGGPQPLLEVEWWADDALPFDLRVAGYAGGQPFTDGAHALGNLVLAGHGRSSGAAVALGAPRSDGTVPLPPPSAPLTRAVPHDPRAARGAPAAAALRPDPRRALPAVRVVDGEGHAWTPVHDLLGSGPFSRDVVVEIDEDESAVLRFGDGRLGMRPDPGARLRASWRTGYGPAGSVGPDALTQLVASGDAALSRWAPRVVAVRNPLAAAGGARREPLERVRMAAPEAYRALARAVTADDWRAAALTAPGVLHATAELRWAGSWPTAFVAVQRAGAEADDAYLERVRAVLEPLRPAGHALAVRGPAWAALDVELRVRVHSRRVQRAVRGALAAALGDGVRADGTPAFFHPDRWTFGEHVHLAPLLAAAMGVDGVRDVSASRFRRMDAAQGAPAVADPVPVGPREVARATPAAGAERACGRIAFVMEGGE
jgi:hypothetical protein